MGRAKKLKEQRKAVRILADDAQEQAEKSYKVPLLRRLILPGRYRRSWEKKTADSIEYAAKKMRKRLKKIDN